MDLRKQSQAQVENSGDKKIDDEPLTDYERYKQLNKYDLKASLAFLNIADIKNLTNRSLKSISFNLMLNLNDLCVWGNYNISNDGILELCMANRKSKLKRLNYCGCYKVTDDARLWLSTSFQQCVANYIKVEDFGKGIDYESYVDQ